MILGGLLWSLPARERGLNLALAPLRARVIRSLPARERGLKPVFLYPVCYHLESLPARERGLKLLVHVNRQQPQDRSLPARERGLKPIIDALYYTKITVAPRAGAWIETICV